MINSLGYEIQKFNIFIRKIIKKIIKKMINSLGYEIQKIRSVNSEYQNFQHFLALYFSKISLDDFFFIQIGTNDGKTNDPIYNFVLSHNLSGILIEPQEYVFEKLKQNYRDNNNLIFENVAISNKDGYQKMYKVKESYQKIFTNATGIYATGISSFNKDHLKKNLKKKKILFKKNDYIEEIKVETLTLKTLLQKYEIKKIDFLQVDVEGFDFEIIKMIDFNRFSPSLINYENKNLNVIDQIKCEKYLQSKGYTLFRHGDDTCAFK